MTQFRDDKLEDYRWIDFRCMEEKSGTKWDTKIQTEQTELPCPERLDVESVGTHISPSPLFRMVK